MSDAARIRHHARMILMLMGYTERRFPYHIPDVVDDFGGDESMRQFSVPWALHHVEIDGKTPVEWLLAEQGSRMLPSERAWFGRELAGWLSIWEVREVVPGASLALVDLLSGAERTVREASASQTLTVGDAVLARVTIHDDGVALDTLYPSALGPRNAAFVVEAMRKKLRRRNLVPVDRLRPFKVADYLLYLWEISVDDEAMQYAQPPQVTHNTEGDPLQWIDDHFDIAPADRDRVRTALAALEHVGAPAGAADDVWTMSRPDPADRDGTRVTIVAMCRFTDTGIVLETNSRKRANRARKELERAAGSALVHRRRERIDGPTMGLGAGLPEPSPEAMAEAMQQIMRKYQEQWIDESIPALGGLTPRAAVRTAEGRRKLEPLLKEMERMQRDMPTDAIGMDVAVIRRMLGMA